MEDGAGDVVVVDNGSSDGSTEMVRRDFPGVALIADHGNIGYGAASNIAMQHARAEYVLLLNADTRLHRGALAAMADYLDEQPQVAIVGPKLLNDDGTLQLSCFPFPGTVGWLVENDPIASVVGALPLVRNATLRFAPPTRATPVPWVLGAALGIRRSAFENVAGFDPSFFMYFEEVDLCKRLALNGWFTHYCPEVRITHVGQASTRQIRPAMLVAHYRSTVQYYHKHTRGVDRSFWLGLMRAKMYFRLLRDTARSTISRRHRQHLRERVAAWREALGTRS